MFDTAISDIITQITNVCTKIEEFDTSWNNKQTETSETMKNKLDRNDMEPFKQQLESRLKNLKKLLEVTKNEEACGRTDMDEMSGFRKPMIGFQNVAYS